MKKLLFITAILSSTLLSAQTDMNKWSVGVSVGGHDGMAPTKGHTRLYQLHHYGANGRYMFNNRFGVMLDLGYDLFDYYGSNDRNPRYLRTSIQGVVNAGDIIKLNTINRNLGLLVHGGSGISNMWLPKAYKAAEPNDPGFKNSDDMINWIFGATPQWKINNLVALNADLSFIFHTRQSNDFTQSNVNKRNGIDGYFLNLSVGANFYLGTKGNKHADWTPTVYGGAATDMTKYDQLVKELQDKTKDDDMDGVPNYVDAEANTPKGSFVDSKGVSVKDTDEDGIYDAYDACPDKKGTYSNDGCPDTDNDGIGDNRDACPTVPGLMLNKGCPEVTKEVKEVMNRALKGVEFETGKDVLLPSSFPVLNDVIKVMMDHPEYKLAVEGHTDNVGNDEDNMILSEKRARAVGVYLISKGIEAERLDIHGHGETRPKALNDTEQGRQENRRVDFTIIF